jgi:hypothetical protein
VSKPAEKPLGELLNGGDEMYLHLCESALWGTGKEPARPKRVEY